jgi:hypothetical protein
MIDGLGAALIDFSRRELCVTGPAVMTATFLGGALIGISPASAAEGLLTPSFGSNSGGAPFTFEYPQSIGLSTAAEVDALFLNGTQHGGDGGGTRTDATLADGDYWNYFSVRHAGRVDYLEFRSRNGQVVAGGGRGGEPAALSGIRILGIAGRAGARLDQIVVKYIPNYQPSTRVQPRVKVIVDVQAGPVTIKTYTDQSAQSAQSFERTIEHMSEFTMTASAEGELFSSFSVSTGLKIQDTSREFMKRSSEDVLKSGRSMEKPIPADQVGFLIAEMDVMRDANGRFWMLPRNSSFWLYLKDSDFGRLNGFYDMTGIAAAQTGRSVTEYRGFDYFPG